MKTTQLTKSNSSSNRNFAQACAASCRQIVEQIKRARSAVSAQFSEVIAGHEHLLHLALNEAEALAWQTPYPQLVFADLAEEKAQSVAAWHDRQQSILQHNFPSAVPA